MGVVQYASTEKCEHCKAQQVLDVQKFAWILTDIKEGYFCSRGHFWTKSESNKSSHKNPKSRDPTEGGINPEDYITLTEDEIEGGRELERFEVKSNDLAGLIE